MSAGKGGAACGPGRSTVGFGSLMILAPGRGCEGFQHTRKCTRACGGSPEAGSVNRQSRSSITPEAVADGTARAGQGHACKGETGAEHPCPGVENSPGRSLGRSGRHSPQPWLPLPELDVLSSSSLPPLPRLVLLDGGVPLGQVLLRE